MAGPVQLKFVWYFQEGPVLVLTEEYSLQLTFFVFNTAMYCFILFSIQMFAKGGMSAGNQVVQPTLERFFLSSIMFLNFEARTSDGVAGNLSIKNLLSAVCDLFQAGRFQKNFCLFSRDY